MEHLSDEEKKGFKGEIDNAENETDIENILTRASILNGKNKEEKDKTKEKLAANFSNKIKEHSKFLHLNKDL